MVTSVEQGPTTYWYRQRTFPDAFSAPSTSRQGPRSAASATPTA